MTLIEFRVLCRACDRRWIRFGNTFGLLCVFCGSADYEAVRVR